MAAIRTPRIYQLALRDFALDNRRANWWAGTGTGKTGSGLETYDHLYTFGEVEHLLVVSTKRIAKMVWTNERDKWENFHHLSIATAIGTPDQRLAALKRRAHITTINYDNLPWLIETAGDAWYWDMVIADESTRVKGLRIDVRKHHKSGKTFMRKAGGSERAMQLAYVAHKRVRYWINMTGTPSPNGLIDLWGQQWYIDAGKRLGRSFSAYKERFFNSIRAKGDEHRIIVQPAPFADAQIKALMADCTITIDAKDYFDLPPLVKNIVSVPLPPKAYAQYREMEKQMFVEIENNPIEAFNAGSKSMKCRQIASGAAYLEDDGRGPRQWVLVHDEKIEALHDIVTEANGSPVIVAYQFQSDLERLKKAFPQGRYFDDNPRTLEAFRRGEIPVLFVHPASAGHGIDGMQDSCNIVVWFSMTWNLEEFEQLIERVGPTRQAQSGRNKTVYVHLLVAENTVDEEMVERVETKATVQESLKSAMKKRGR